MPPPVACSALRACARAHHPQTSCSAPCSLVLGFACARACARPPARRGGGGRLRAPHFRIANPSQLTHEQFRHLALAPRAPFQLAPMSRAQGIRRSARGHAPLTGQRSFAAPTIRVAHPHVPHPASRIPHPRCALALALALVFVFALRARVASSRKRLPQAWAGRSLVQN